MLLNVIQVVSSGRIWGESGYSLSHRLPALVSACSDMLEFKAQLISSMRGHPEATGITSMEEIQTAQEHVRGDPDKGGFVWISIASIGMTLGWV